MLTLSSVLTHFQRSRQDTIENTTNSQKTKVRRKYVNRDAEVVFDVARELHHDAGPHLLEHASIPHKTVVVASFPTLPGILISSQPRRSPPLREHQLCLPLCCERGRQCNAFWHSLIHQGEAPLPLPPH
jgi:hypothetical protein